MLNALRLREGFALARFAERTGLPLAALEPALAAAERAGWSSATCSSCGRRRAASTS